MTGWLVLRMCTEGAAGPYRVDLRDDTDGTIGACFVYATERQAIEASDGAEVLPVNIPEVRR